MQVSGPFGPVGVPVSGFTMLQHQIKAVHESAHQEEKQRQDQGDLERRPSFSTRSPTILDRDGKRSYVTALNSVSSSCISNVFVVHICSIALEKYKMMSWALRMNEVQDGTPSRKDSFKWERVGQCIVLLARSACGR